ncbi:MAG: FAD-dependent oxidoreductase [Clostridiales bacterium]|jgi:sarcosine oxidase subunit alpha|nr:FAD-dependent oxidoreductase [Clostridiales bacterium]
MIHTDLLICGAGPAGLCAAIEAGAAGADVLVLERGHAPGGQLVKQTHMFFGSEKQYASYRGFDISDILVAQMSEMPNIRLICDATVLAAYDDGVFAAEIAGKYEKIRPRATVVATGASEKPLLFPGNDLPGVYGAGAVQTLMNQYGIRPAGRVVMLGAGNIGLIVSYQLLQAGVDVLVVCDGAPKIGGYLVHASKLARMGVPIMTSHSVKRAEGEGKVEKVTLWELDKNWQGIAGTEKIFAADTLCVAVGLSPLSELLWQAGCEMLYVPALGGYVPYRDAQLSTSIPGIFVAGDVAGVEEASSAMVTGRLAGLAAAGFLGLDIIALEAKKEDCLAQLHSLRHGHGGKILDGIQQALLDTNNKGDEHA